MSVSNGRTRRSAWAGFTGLLLGASLVVAPLLLSPARAAPPLARRGWPAERLVGTVAPAIEARGLDGAAISLASRRGRVVVLEFWATWCGACRTIIPSMERLHREQERRGISVLAVSDESLALVTSFQRRMGIGYPIAGEGARAAFRYRVQALPTLVLIDRSGVVRDVSIGVPPAGFGAIQERAEQLLGSGFGRALR
ncbi:MAG: TlpA family protein disulfide reductase [Deltaproteobacteria bacterium]|nr:TlpA family protein disulfide reductase [Deltaproteobacteria bacterium]